MNSAAADIDALPIEPYPMFDHPQRKPAPTLAELLDAAAERKAQGPWVPGCGGTEVPFIARSGARLLCCWQPSTGRHAYLDCGTDLILTDEEARAHLGTW